MTWCAYAACHQPATDHADGWDFCRPHLYAHRKLAKLDATTDRENDLKAQRRVEAYRRGQVLRMWRKGMQDVQIARSLHLSSTRVGQIRRDIGLQPNRRAAECGTRSGYQRHRNHGEKPCEQCRQAQSDYDREYHLLRKQQAA